MKLKILKTKIKIKIAIKFMNKITRTLLLLTPLRFPRGRWITSTDHKTVLAKLNP